ncbi:hypothetical protein SmphiM6_97 [Sinorhizobium phage phiM6]|nr:hypothetical protein SmphiM6_97 [Sinorhizobium phage phiM6]
MTIFSKTGEEIEVGDEIRLVRSGTHDRPSNIHDYGLGPDFGIVVEFRPRSREVVYGVSNHTRYLNRHGYDGVWEIRKKNKQYSIDQEPLEEEECL